MSDESTSRFKSTKRNDACPCGSGKKYKKCHLAEDQAAQNVADAKAAEQAIAAAAAAAEEEANGKTDEAGAKKASTTTPKGTRPRGKGRAASGAQSKSTKPNNLPRRKAV